MMHKFIFTLLITTSVSSFSSENDFPNVQHGQCGVLTNVDDFTDEKSFILACEGKGSNLGTKGVSVFCDKNKFITMLMAGLQFHTEDTINAVYRFDKGEVGESLWRFNGKNGALYFGEVMHNEFLSGINDSKKMVFKVGSESVSVDLTESSKAVSVYKERCKSIGNPIKTADVD